jgi:ribosomal protein L29
MKKTSYINTPVADLKKSLVEKRTALRESRFGKTSKNTKLASIMRKDIARIMTELTKHK